MFLLLFSVIFGTETIDIAGRGSFSVAQFYAPSLAVFAAASATYTNLGVRTAIARDEGVLKRFRGTPLPAWAYMAGLVGSAVWIALIATALMMTVGVVAFDVNIELAKMPAALLSFVTGAACFAALGLALAAAAPTGDSAPAMANATILPLAFLSDVFIAIDNPPAWLTAVGNFFPLKHFVRAFQDAFHPLTASPAFRFEHLGVMAIWGVVGALIALRFFSWEPRQGGSGKPRHRGRLAAESLPKASSFWPAAAVEESITVNAAVRVENASKVYGEGDTRVTALDGHDSGLREGEVHRHHGSLGIGQVHAAALRRRPRHAHLGAVSTSATSASAISTTRRSPCCAGRRSGSSSRPST